MHPTPTSGSHSLPLSQCKQHVEPGLIDHAACFAGDDTWVIVASDGLFENDVRGGGGGLENQQVVDMCLKAKDSTSAQQLARELIEAAQAEGTTDDVTVALLKLSV